MFSQKKNQLSKVQGEKSWWCGVPEEYKFSPLNPVGCGSTVTWKMFPFDDVIMQLIFLEWIVTLYQLTWYPLGVIIVALYQAEGRVTIMSKGYPILQKSLEFICLTNLVNI